MHLSDGSNIMCIVIELKQTIFMNDFDMATLPSAIFYEPRASVINSNTKQTKHRLHSAGSVVIASNNIIAITR